MEEDEEKSHALRIGNIVSSIRSSLAATKEMNTQSLQQLKDELEAISLQAESLHLDQTSLVMNTNLLEVLNIQASIRMLTACTASSLVREESRGQFKRSDFPESSHDFLYHITVDAAGQTGRLALKKGAGGHWILAPQEE